ncbi:hypothetical protein [Kocuria palustris]|uniref:hypothetical protein n=1 Tax=Kocuria palustris TaxID=71999 RepID=UPI00242CF8A9|nr:hypothetical protein [Kocuria palustris]
MTSYTIRVHPQDRNRVLVTRREDFASTSRIVHVQDADPEPRLMEHRLAAGWYGHMIAAAPSLPAALAQALEDRDRPVAAALIRLAETDQRIYDRFVGPLLDQLENAATSAGAQIMTAEPSTHVRA